MFAGPSVFRGVRFDGVEEEERRRRDSGSPSSRPVRDLGRCRFALEHGAEWLPLPPGETVIGRGDGCDVVLEDRLISRRHCKFTVTDSAVFVEDLGSVNGVRLDGDPIQGKTLVSAGARIAIGETLFHLTRTPEDAALRNTARMPTRDADEVNGPKSDRQITRRTQAFRLIANVVDKALALGQADEAERLLGGLLQDVLVEAQRGGNVSQEIAESAASSALKLAGASGRAQWLDYVIRLYIALERILPNALVDQLYSVWRKTERMDLILLERYVKSLSLRQLTPSERFTLQRIQNLAKMVAVAGR